MRIFLIIVNILLLLAAFELNFYRKKQRTHYSYYNRELKRVQVNEKKYLSGLSLNQIMPDFSGVTLYGDSVEIKKNNSSLYLIIFFNQLDCPSCLLEIPIWNGLNNTFADSSLKIIGIANGVTKNNLIAFVENRKIYFDIIYDKDDRIKEKLQISNTPIRLILDRNFRILDIEKPSYDNLKSKRLTNKICKMLNGVNNLIRQ